MGRFFSSSYIKKTIHLLWYFNITTNLYATPILYDPLKNHEHVKISASLSKSFIIRWGPSFNRRIVTWDLGSVTDTFFSIVNVAKKMFFHEKNRTINELPIWNFWVQSNIFVQCTGYSFFLWNRLRNFLHTFTWIVLSVHKLNKLGSGKFMDNY